jgi:hypothetical protein
MPRLELVLVDWPDRPDLDGPRLLGRLRDEDLVNEAQDRLAADHLRQLRELRPPVRAVPSSPEGPEG